MKTVCLTVRGCPSEIHEALTESAAANRRSLNGEIVEWLTRQAAVSRPGTRLPEAQLRQRIRALRFKTRLTPEEVRAAITEGRP